MLDTTLCDKVGLWLATCQCVSLVSSTNKTERDDMTEILLKVAFKSITLTLHVSHLSHDCINISTEDEMYVIIYSKFWYYAVESKCIVFNLTWPRLARWPLQPWCGFCFYLVSLSVMLTTINICSCCMMTISTQHRVVKRLW